MPACEYQCMECKMEFAISFSEKDVDKKPKIMCPHCGSEHAHIKAAECK